MENLKVGDKVIIKSTNGHNLKLNSEATIITPSEWELSVAVSFFGTATKAMSKGIFVEGETNNSVVVTQFVLRQCLEKVSETTD